MYRIPDAARRLRLCGTGLAPAPLHLHSGPRTSSCTIFATKIAAAHDLSNRDGCESAARDLSSRQHKDYSSNSRFAETLFALDYVQFCRLTSSNTRKIFKILALRSVALCFYFTSSNRARLPVAFSAAQPSHTKRGQRTADRLDAGCHVRLVSRGGSKVSRFTSRTSRTGAELPCCFQVLCET